MNTRVLTDADDTSNSAPAIEAADLDSLSSVYYGAWQAESLRYREEHGRRGWKDAAHRAGIAAVVAHLRPTSPPGLLGAVAPFIVLAERIEDTAALNPPPGLMVVASVCDDYCRLAQVTVADVRRLRAAYDAAKGVEHGPDSTCPNCKADHEDAAKYRAAVERAKDKEGMARALYAVVRGKTMRWNDASDVVRHDAEVAAIAVAEHLLTLDTPPSGPGGGHEDCPDNPCPGHHPYCEGVGRHLPPPECGDVAQRPPGKKRSICRRPPHGEDVPHRWIEEPNEPPTAQRPSALETSLSEPSTAAPDSNSPQTPDAVWEGK